MLKKVELDFEFQQSLNKTSVIRCWNKKPNFPEVVYKVATAYSYLKKSLNIMATFLRKFVIKNCQKSPDLVTLNKTNLTQIGILGRKCQMDKHVQT